MIKLIDPVTKKQLVEYENGLCFLQEQGSVLQQSVAYPLINGAYNLVNESNYTDNFGREWNEFQKTQIDKFNGKTISFDRFFAQTGWTNFNLHNKAILEVGSGAGRFSQIVLDHTNANLYSVDYSSAVEANYRNNGPHPRLKLFRASVYDLPFENESFDYVFCFGVLQHTPDFKKSIQCLVDMIKPGGELVVDFYPIKGWYSKVNAKYLLRPFTKNMKHDKLMRLIRSNVKPMIRSSRFFSKIGLGRILNRFIPVCDIETTIPANISEEQLTEWVVLDTFDMFSPAFDNPQSISTVKNWFLQFGMTNVNGRFVRYAGNFESAVVSGVR